MATRVDADRVIRLVARGAPLLDVLPRPIYEQEHLPGATSLPLETFAVDQVDHLDRRRPVVVYCFDQHCDLSSRAAARLEAEGFTEVFDLIGGRATWTALGLATEGTVGDRRRISHHLSPADRVSFDATMADVVALGPRDPVAVVGEADVLLGALHPTAAALPGDTPVARAMVPAPGTIRPAKRVDDVVEQLRRDSLDHVFVTTVSGALLGIARLGELDG